MTDYESDNRANEADRREKKGGAGVAIVVILIIIIGLAVYFLTRKPAPKMGKDFEILPKECVMLVIADLDQAEDKDLRDQLWKMIKENPKAKKNLEKLEKEHQVDVEKDVMAGVGNRMTMSMFEAPKNMGKRKMGGPKPKPEHFAVVFSIKNKEMAAKKLPELTKKAKYTEEKYEEITIHVPAEKDQPHVAIVKGTLVLTDNVDDMKKVIDVSKGKAENLKKNENVRKVLGKLPQPMVGTMYMDMKTIAKEGQGNVPKRGPGAEEAKQLMDALGGLGIGVGMKDGNIVGAAFMEMKADSESQIVKSIMQTKPTMGNPESLKLFPKDTTYYGAIDMKYILTIVFDIVESKDKGKKQLEQVRSQLKAQMGIDLDKDIIENLQGELAYSVDMADLMKMGASRMPGAPGGRMGRRRRQVPPFIIAIRVKDEAKLKEVMGKLTGGRMGAMLKKRQHGDVQIYDMPQQSGSFCQFKDFVLIGMGTAGKKLDMLIDNKMDPGKSLTQTEGYKLVKGKINDKTIGVGMMQFEKILPMMELASQMAPPDKAGASKSAMKFLKKYKEVWSVSEIGKDGFTSYFYVLKDKEAEKK